MTHLPAPSPAPVHSLARRYVFKLVSNVVAIPLFLVVEMLLPRALGPTLYGNLGFTASFFQNLLGFLDTGVSNWFVTRLARRPGETALAAFYLRFWLGVLCVCLACAVLFWICPALSARVLPGVPSWMFLPCALWMFLTVSSWMLRGASDALGLTVRSEKIRSALCLLAAAVLVLLSLGGVLSLPVFFAHQYVYLGLLAAGYLWLARPVVAPAGGFSLRLAPGQNTAYVRELWDFSHPLLVSTLTGMLAIFADRWMLQIYTGSVSQGYFSLSEKISMACVLFTTAMMPLFMREMSIAHGRGDLGTMGRLVDRLVPLIYAVAAWFSCFIFMEAESVVRIFGGAEFAGAVLAVRVLAFFPMHQTFGQSMQATYFALGATRLMRNIVVNAHLLGICLTWLLLSPASPLELRLGAEGLACKRVIIQILSTNACLFFCARQVPFHYGRNLLLQLLCPAALLCAAFAAHHMAAALLPGHAPFWVLFLGAGVCYALLSAGLLYAFPFLAGTTRERLHSLVQRARRTRPFRRFRP